MDITISDIKEANYAALVYMLKERNRASGGVRTIHEFASNAFINPEKKVLEVGSNTGFSMVNLTALTGAQCYGIDPCEESVLESRKYAEEMGVGSTSNFDTGVAEALEFPDAYFDAVWCSNVTSFISDKESAVKEYFRVLKPNGILGIAPIYYTKKPPESLLNKVEEYIGTKIDVQTLDGWKALVENITRTLGISVVNIYQKHYGYEDQKARISNWIENISNKPHINKLSSDVRGELVNKYADCIEVFNENLKYCQFSLVLYQKKPAYEEPELFLTKEVFN